MKKFIRRYFKWIILGGILLLILGWRQYTLWTLPYDDLLIPPIGKEGKLAIPPRPGIQGIVITGPQIEPLFFSIDLSKAGVRSLDWMRLQQVDPHTDVKINCQVDFRGRLFFSQKDLMMEGHTDAGMIIQKALRTWVYTPYKSGTVQFWFNLPSKGKKLTINTKGLKRKRGIPNHIPVYNGRLYFIDGIPHSEVIVRVGS